MTIRAFLMDDHEVVRQGVRALLESSGEIEVVGVFTMGTSFGIDGTVITSDDNWMRLFPERPREDISWG